MKKGFTLIEILVVATIIGLLAAVAATSYSSLTKNARDARRKTDLQNIAGAFEQYRSNNNSYPTLVTITCSSGSITDSSGRTYMSTIPIDPKCATNTYAASISASDYTLGAYIENSTAAQCGGLTCGANNCNFCLGPYGQK
jgi:general secretion pathway protein G